MRLGPVGRLFLREETLRGGFIALLAAARRLEDRVAVRAQEREIALPAALILIAVWAEPGIDRKGLERILARRRPTLAPLLGELVEAGLIERRPLPADRRRRGFYPSARGSAIAETCFSPAARLLKEAFRAEGEESVAGFLNLLDRLAARNAAPGGSRPPGD